MRQELERLSPAEKERKAEHEEHSELQLNHIRKISSALGSRINPLNLPAAAETSSPSPPRQRAACWVSR